MWKQHKMSMGRRMHEEKMAYIHNGVLFHLKKEGNPSICHSMNEPGGDYAKENKIVTRGQVKKQRLERWLPGAGWGREWEAVQWV